MDKSVSHLVQVLFLELACLHETSHVVSFRFFILLSLLESLGLWLVPDLTKNLLPPRKTAPNMSQQIGESFLGHFRIRNVKRHRTKMVHQRLSCFCFDDA